MNNQRLLAYLLLLGTTIIWGFALPIIKFTLTDFPPITFLTYRFFISLLIALPIFVLVDDKIPKAKPGEWFLIILAGLLVSSINLGLLFWGIDNTTALASTLIGLSSPIVIVFAGIIFLREKVTGQEKLGLVIAFLGSLFVTISPSVLNQPGTTVFGNALIIVANLAWVAYLIICKRVLYDKVSPLFLATSSFVLGFLSLLPFAIAEQGSLANLVYTIADQPTPSQLGVFYIAAISGVVAYWLYQEGQKRIEISEATIFSYLNPIFAAPLAILWLGESVTTPFLIGAVVIATGVVIAEYKKRGRKAED